MHKSQKPPSVGCLLWAKGHVIHYLKMGLCTPGSWRAAWSPAPCTGLCANQGSSGRGGFSDRLGELLRGNKDLTRDSSHLLLLIEVRSNGNTVDELQILPTTNLWQVCPAQPSNPQHETN